MVLYLCWVSGRILRLFEFIIEAASALGLADAIARRFWPNRERLIKRLEYLEERYATEAGYRPSRFDTSAATIQLLRDVILFLGRNEKMDPITLLGAIASIIEIVTFLQRVEVPVTFAAIKQEFRQRAAKPGTLESQIEITDEQLTTEILSILDLQKIDNDFIKRIEERCLPPYREKRQDPNVPEVDVEEAYAIARNCVCQNIRLARQHHGGKFPSESFKKLWEMFNCGSST